MPVLLKRPPPDYHHHYVVFMYQIDFLGSTYVPQCNFSRDFFEKNIWSSMMGRTIEQSLCFMYNFWAIFTIFFEIIQLF